MALPLPKRVFRIGRGLERGAQKLHEPFAGGLACRAAGETPSGQPARCRRYSFSAR
jgi:hypothetical protein